MVIVFLRVLGIGLLLSACAGATLTSWHGQPANALVRSWGPPTEVWDQDDGGRLLIYRDSEPHVVYQSGKAESALFAFRCVVTFRTNSAGVIVSSSTDSSIAGCERLLADRPAAGEELSAPPPDLRVRPQGRP